MTLTNLSLSHCLFIAKVYSANVTTKAYQTLSEVIANASAKDWRGCQIGHSCCEVERVLIPSKSEGCVTDISLLRVNHRNNGGFEQYVFEARATRPAPF